jgi:predicted acetyltransferase
MNLRKKMISEDEAERLGAVPFSLPCRVDSELWIIENMIKDFKRAGWGYALVKSVYKSHSTSKYSGETTNWEKPALELWKIN